MPEARLSYNFLFYDRSAGEAEVLDANQGTLTRLRQWDTFRTSWTHIVPLTRSTEEHRPFDLFLYDASRGEAELYATDKSGRMDLHKQFTGLRTSWSEIIPGEFLPSPWRTDLLFYDRSNGEGEIHSFDSDGEMVRRASFTGWRTSWSHIVAKRIIPKPNFFDDLLFYDSSTGDVRLYTLDGEGELHFVMSDFTPLRTNYSQILPLPQWDVLCYAPFGVDLLEGDPSNLRGRAVVLVNSAAASSVDRLDFTTAATFTGWRSSWDQIVPFDMEWNVGTSFQDFFFYDRTAGEAEIRAFERDQDTDNLRMRPVLQFDGLRTSWTQIVPIRIFEPAEPEDGDGDGQELEPPATTSVQYRMGPFDPCWSNQGPTGEVRFRGDLVMASGEASSPEGMEAFDVTVDWPVGCTGNYYIVRALVGNLKLGRWQIQAEYPPGVFQVDCEVDLDRHRINESVNFTHNLGGCARGFSWPGG